MESSLASLFMEGNLPCLPFSWATSGETIEELQEKLTSTAMELQNGREAARLQSRIHEAKIDCLHALLDGARKERDEARNKCSKLRDCLLQLSRSPQVPMPAADSPSSSFPSSISSTCSHPASPTMDTMNIEDFKQNMCAEEGMFELGISMKLSSEYVSDVQDIFAMEQKPDPSSITMGDSQKQFSMEILNEDVNLTEEESLDLVDLHVENSPRSSVQPKQASKFNWDFHASDDFCLGNTLLRSSSSAGSESSAGSGPSKTITTLDNKPISMFSYASEMRSSAASPSPTTFYPRIASEYSRYTSQTAQPQSTSMQPVTAHVVPFERDASIVLEDALPVKGKLLQAVMQAGPLLQNLLLAGPLPQWRYPPPQLSSMDILKVPMAPSGLPLEYPPALVSCSNHARRVHPNPLVNFPVFSGPVSAPQCADVRGVLPPQISFASMSGGSSYYGGRKLRRLSPIGAR